MEGKALLESFVFVNCPGIVYSALIIRKGGGGSLHDYRGML